MNTIICGIPIIADPGITMNETKKLVLELVQDWDREGRRLGRIELIRDGQWIHLCSYEQTSHAVGPYTTIKTKE
ncbi:MAG: hypothetical protein ABFD50_03960 [Smithella sp.]